MAAARARVVVRACEARLCPENQEQNNLCAGLATALGGKHKYYTKSIEGQVRQKLGCVHLFYIR